MKFHVTLHRMVPVHNYVVVDAETKEDAAINAMDALASDEAGQGEIDWDGAEDAGHDVESVSTEGISVNPCIKCGHVCDGYPCAKCQSDPMRDGDTMCAECDEDES